MQLYWELSTFSIVAFSEYVQERPKPGSGSAKHEIRRITMLLYYKGQRYWYRGPTVWEVRGASHADALWAAAFSQLRKMSQIKKQQNEAKVFSMR